MDTMAGIFGMVARYLGNDYPMVPITPADMDHLMDPKTAKFCGVPVYFDTTDLSRIWPQPSEGCQVFKVTEELVAECKYTTPIMD